MNAPDPKPNTLVLGVCGGIAAYKSPELVRRLKDAGFEVHVVLTPAAQEFVTPLALQSTSGQLVHTELFDLEQESKISHIQLADLPEMILVAPATADLIAKYAQGLCNDLLSTLLIATTRPVYLCPSMNTNMWSHPATQKNLEILKARGVKILEPSEGSLACGYEGAGRLPEIPEIVKWVSAAQKPQNLKGKKVLVTAGPTREYIDPVRFISNPSSGKMGYALAEEAQKRGAEVFLVSGPSSLPPPSKVHFVSITTAQEMFEATQQISDQMDILICSAAVSDFKPSQSSKHKVKKQQASLQIDFEANPDILASLGAKKKKNQFLVGFAAETFSIEEEAQKKLKNKNLDMICANDVSKEGLGFASENNQILLISKRETKLLPILPKKKIAEEIWNEIETRLNSSK